MSDCSVNDQAKGSVIMFILLAGFAGCSRSEPAPTADEPQGRVEQRSAVVTTVDRAEYDAALVLLHGKVVLVDCWATWCVPCLQQLPHSLELAEKNGSDGLTVLTLSFDDPSKSPQVQKVLASKGGDSQGTHYISKQGGSPASMDAFEITGGALPHYKLYDRKGKLRRTFALDPAAKKQFTHDDVSAAVAELLAEAP